jgi:hypothetical protein
MIPVKGSQLTANLFAHNLLCGQLRAGQGLLSFYRLQAARIKVADTL